MILKLKNTNVMKISDIDINKILVSDKLPFGKQDFRYFFGYKDDKNIRPLCIFLPTKIAYGIDFEETECMYFMIKEEKLFVKSMNIWENINNVIKKN